MPFHFSCFGHSDAGEEAEGGERDELRELFFDDTESVFGVGSGPCFDGRFLDAWEQEGVDLGLVGAHVHGFSPVEEAEDVPAEVVEGFAAESAIGFGEEPMFDIGAGAKGFEITGRVECGGEFLAQEVAGIDIAGSAIIGAEPRDPGVEGGAEGCGSGFGGGAFSPVANDFEDAVFAGDFFCFAEFGEFGCGEFHSAAAGFGERFEEAGGEIFGCGEGRE